MSNTTGPFNPIVAQECREHEARMFALQLAYNEYIEESEAATVERAQAFYDFLAGAR